MHILLAAPDRNFLECYQQILAPSFGEVVTAFDGTQILALLQEERFDLVLLDSDVPRVDRRILVRRIREKKIPLIEMTAGDGREGEAQPDACLSHPFTPEEICGAVKELLKTENGSGEENTDE